MTRALIKAFAKAIYRTDKTQRKMFYDFVVGVFAQIQPSFNKKMFADESGVKLS